MADMIGRGMAWLANKLGSHASTEIEYSRDSDSVTLNATPGRTLFRLSDDTGGTHIEWCDRDFIFKASLLVLDGDVVLPERGDEIREDIDGVTYVFEVRTPPGEPVWRWVDAQHTMVRVHCKQIGTE